MSLWSILEFSSGLSAQCLWRRRKRRSRLFFPTHERTPNSIQLLWHCFLDSSRLAHNTQSGTKAEGDGTLTPSKSRLRRATSTVGVCEASGVQSNALDLVAAAMQALRLASFTHKPSLSAIQTLLMIGSYLTNNGRMLDSFALFGTTIRLAHSVGLHRHPKYLNPAPTNGKDCVIRQKVWWHMLHLDEHMSMTLGRPLGISGIGDNPWPTQLTTDPVLLRFGEFVNHFTILARQIMSSNPLTNARINEFTDILRRLLDTIPETLQFRDTWMLPETPLPDLSAIATGTFQHSFACILVLVLNRYDLAIGNLHLESEALETQSRVAKPWAAFLLLPLLGSKEDVIWCMHSLTCCSILFQCSYLHRSSEPAENRETCHFCDNLNWQG